MVSPSHSLLCIVLSPYPTVFSDFRAAEGMRDPLCEITDAGEVLCPLRVLHEDYFLLRAPHIGESYCFRRFYALRNTLTRPSRIFSHSPTFQTM